ncbi:MAG: hypothetical protein ABI947_15025 [Chloroflexota bacterium]
MTDNDQFVCAYFQYNGMRYRIKVFEDGVKAERQTPRAYGGNLTMPIERKAVLIGDEMWSLEAIPALLDDYERLLLVD